MPVIASDRKRLLFTLGILSALTFSVVLVAYAVVSGNPISSRLAFAAFIAVVPALLALVLFHAVRLPVSRRVVTSVYFGLLILAQLVLEGLR